MRLIKPSYEILPQENMFKHIEKCGRVCYKSEGDIREDSAERFVNMLINRKHGAMLEHGTVYLTTGIPAYWFKENKYSIVNVGYNELGAEILYITTNYRVLIENNWLSMLQYQCEPTKFHEKRVTVKFNCGIDVSREFNRHRVDSIAESSTRYCNFSKEQFGNEITYIQPSWVSDEQIDGIHKSSRIIAANDEYGTLYEKETYDWNAVDWWIWSSACAELAYLNLVRLGWPAQQARDSLNLSTKTELIHTAFVSDWKHFFELRTAKDAHPSARELAIPLHLEFEKLNLI